MFKKISNKFVYFFFFVFLLVGISTFKDYGISVDEEYHRFAGFYWLKYVLSFTSLEELKISTNFKFNQIKDFTLPHPKDNIYYGPFFDMPMAFFEVIFKIDDPKNYFYLRHIAGFIIFFIGSIYFYKLLLNRFFSKNISLIGTLFFVLSPRIYGSSFFNPKDVVFLSLATIALFYCFKVFDKFNYKNLLIFSFFSALCLSHRFLGIFIPISFLFFYFLSILSNTKDLKKVSGIIFFCFFYIIFLILLWPVLWTGPLESFIAAFKFFSDHYLKINILFNGEYVQSDRLPFSYIPIWIFISSPILYTVLFLIGYFYIFRNFILNFINVKEGNSTYDLWNNNEEKKDLFILFNITCVIIYFITFDIVLYNGWRHAYFVNIFIIYVSIYAFFKIYLKLKLNVQKKTQIILTLCYLIFILSKMIIYHPYQNIYFNSIFSNANIHKKFEVDYWGLSGQKFLTEILALEKNKRPIEIGVASWLPLHRSIKMLDKNNREKIKIIGQEYQNADYIYSNFVSEVDKYNNDKYKIPANFTQVDEFILDNIKIYKVFKKNN